jgi:hypothetical protein
MTPAEPARPAGPPAGTAGSPSGEGDARRFGSGDRVADTLASEAQLADMLAGEERPRPRRRDRLTAETLLEGLNPPQREARSWWWPVPARARPGC